VTNLVAGTTFDDVFGSALVCLVADFVAFETQLLVAFE